MKQRNLCAYRGLRDQKGYWRSAKRSIDRCNSIVIPVCLFLMVVTLLLPWLWVPHVSARSTQALDVGLGGCPLFPGDNIWNRDISALPVHANSAGYTASIGLDGHMHADFGSGLYNGSPIGIPYTIVPGTQAMVPVTFGYGDESDPGPYPIPANVPVEGGAQSKGDRHVLVVNSETCKLYEMFSSYPQGDGSWKAGSGAVWDLRSNGLRPQGWTSADAAGLPILPGLVRYDEVASGVITHALRFTVQRSQQAYVWPARHYASNLTDGNLPPMGLRFRLKASFAISAFSPQNQVILRALQHYGMMVADNGSNWFLSGSPDDRWNNDDLAQLANLHGFDFEAVDTTPLQSQPDSAQASQQNNVPTPTPTATRTPTRTPTATPTHPQVLIPIPTMIATTPTIVARQGRKASPGSQDQFSGTVPLLAAGLVVMLLVSIFAFILKRRRKRFI